MGQKINPISNRMALTADWKSKWFAGSKADFRKYLVDDVKIREFIMKKLNNAGIGNVEIVRSRDRLQIRLTTSKPGLVIGRGGQGINLLKEEIQKNFYAAGMPIVRLDIIEERKPELSATLVAQNIGSQVERRIPYRRACKQSLEKSMAAGAKGIKIIVSGRLNGAEIARVEKFQDGSIPLSRFNMAIDYSIYHAKTTYGTVGIKVWLNKGELADQVSVEERA